MKTTPNSATPTPEKTATFTDITPPVRRAIRIRSRRRIKLERNRLTLISALLSTPA